MENLLGTEAEPAADDWTLVPLEAAEDLPEGDIVVPLALWLARREELLARPGRIGVWLAADEQAEALAEGLQALALVAQHFPVFSDGRGYSNARILRERLDFAGEIRAFGDVQRDQIFLMRRCGFDSFALRPDLDAAAAAAALKECSHVYQQATVDPGPPLLRRGAS